MPEDEERAPYFAGEEGRERAREAGRKSAEMRQRRAAMTVEEQALEAISRNVGKLTGELIKAALGQGAFEELKLETRVAALKTLLEYGLGKPTAQGKTDPEADPEREPGPSPESLFARPHVDAAAVSERT